MSPTHCEQLGKRDLYSLETNTKLACSENKQIVDKNKSSINQSDNKHINQTCYIGRKESIEQQK